MAMQYHMTKELSQFFQVTGVFWILHAFISMVCSIVTLTALNLLTMQEGNVQVYIYIILIFKIIQSVFVILANFTLTFWIEQQVSSGNFYSIRLLFYLSILSICFQMTCQITIEQRLQNMMQNLVGISDTLATQYSQFLYQFEFCTQVLASIWTLMCNAVCVFSIQDDDDLINNLYNKDDSEVQILPDKYIKWYDHERKKLQLSGDSNMLKQK